MLKIADDHDVVVDAGSQLQVDLDELCRLAAQEMLAVSLLAERRAYLMATLPWSTIWVVVWWWVTGFCLPGR